MSSSSSDSDSDDFEPIRKIKINIRPKEDVVRKGAADVNEIKASVEAWRPLGPPTHPSLSRRQSSLSSVSSMSFGTNSIYGGSNSTTGAGSQTGGGRGGGGSQTGTTNLHSSPSCSSLVNEFNNRSSFSNFMTTTSRTSSPLTITNYGDAIPVAIAIQESIELIVKGHYDPTAKEPKFDTRFLGNIKIAFPNAFARGNYGKPSAPLRMRMHSTDNIIKYYASRLIKDLDLGTTNSSAELSPATNNYAFITTTQSNTNGQQMQQGNIRNGNNVTNDKHSTNNNNTINNDSNSLLVDSFDFDTTPTSLAKNSKIIEFDMEALMANLRKLYDQAPTSKYYNVDVLRYQLAPIKSIDECPLQVCAYWKIELNLVKIRIDFKHSSKSGLNLERLREINFTVDLTDFIPPGVDINPISHESNLRLNNNINNNNNNAGAMNMNDYGCSLSAMNNSRASGTSSGSSICNPIQQLPPLQASTRRPISLIDDDDFCQLMNNSVFPTNSNNSSGLGSSSAGGLQQQQQLIIPPPPSSGNKSTTTGFQTSTRTAQYDAFGIPLGAPKQPSVFQSSPLFTGQTINLLPTNLGPSSNHTNDMLFSRNNDSSGSIINQQAPSSCNSNLTPPFITFEPQAHWNKSIKQLTWKFDTLLSYYKTDGLGSLFAKLDFRNYHGMPAEFLENCKPTPVDVKFLVTDSTLSKMNLSIDSMGYKMSLLKKEIRSGRYRSEPYIM